MDVYRATSNYEPPQGCVGVIPLMEGDFFEVLESEEYRYHKDWWGVRRTGDNVIGYVPAKYIKVSACYRSISAWIYGTWNDVNGCGVTVGISVMIVPNNLSCTMPND